MTQAIDLGIIANQNGASFRQRINVVQQAIITRSYGATEPIPSYANQEWWQSTTGKIWTRNPTNTAWYQSGTIGPPAEIYNKGAPINLNVVGEIKSFSFPASALDTGWIQCDGRALSRTTYSLLNAKYLAASYPWGAGDGSTTFNVPNISGRAIYGSGQGLTAEGGTSGTLRTLGSLFGKEGHTLTINEIPAHDHTVQEYSGTEGSGQHIVSSVSGAPSGRRTSSVGGSQQHTIQSPGIAMTVAVWTGLTA